MSFDRSFQRRVSDTLQNCKLAVPKKGRLHQKVVELLNGAGVDFHREDRLDVALCLGLDLTIVFLPAADIAKFVGEGNVDIGITGMDVVQESQVDVEQLTELGFGKCRLCVQAPVAHQIQNVEDLAGKRVVTSFTNITDEFFAELDKKKGTKTRVRFVSGSVEAACGLGLADAVVDLVETGTTMRAAGLEVVHEILKTQAVLIANKQSQHKELIELLKTRIEGYITAKQYMLVMYNVGNDVFDAAVKITPGKRSPTVTNLECGNVKAVSSLVKKNDVPRVMDELQKAGATDILVLAMSNSRM